MSAHVTQIARAAQWLFHSGIQNDEGGVARFYRSGDQVYQGVSTEITGYHASICTWIHQTTGSAEALHYADLTARFLRDCAWDSKLLTFPFEYPDASPAYFFDCGIIVRGLLAVSRITNNDGYRELAQVCAGQMARDFDAGFDFHPVLELPGKTASVRDPRWSRSSGCYQLKAALAFHETKLGPIWERVLTQSLQDHNQFLPGHDNEERVMDRLHAYCYFLEALLIGTRTKSAGRAVALGVQRVAYLLHKIERVFVRSDVYAQLLRIRLYADAFGILPLDTHTAAIEAEQLANFQLSSTDRRINGGFCFGRKGAEMLPYVNPVSTAFAMQAMHLWDFWQASTPLPSVNELV